MDQDKINEVSITAQDFLDFSLSYSKFEAHLQPQKVFEEIKSRLNVIIKSDADCRVLMQRTKTISLNVSTKLNFKNNIKIFWRMVKEKHGQPWYKLCLFIISISVMCLAIIERNNVQKHVVKQWKTYVAKWFGVQLTIGGKGVTGCGEGSVLERVERFFCTPYLHDFD